MRKDRGDHETFHWLARDKCIHNLRNIRDGDVAVKKVIGLY
jgi:hypothetical protein